jgi:hypothetical protein
VRLTASYRRSLRRRHLRTLTPTLTTHTVLADNTGTTARQRLRLILPGGRVGALPTALRRRPNGSRVA